MTAHTITLKCGQSDPGARPETGAALRDVATGRMPSTWAGAKTQLRLIFENPFSGEPVDTADWALVTFRFLAADRSTLYAVRNVAPVEFLGTTPREASVTLETSDTALPGGTYWMCVFATLSGGGLLPLAAGPLNLVDSGMLTTEVPPPTAIEAVYTVEQVDALLQGGLQFSRDGNLLTVTDGVQSWVIDMSPAGEAQAFEDGTGAIEEDGTGAIMMNQ